MSDSQRLEELFLQMLAHCAEKRFELRRAASKLQRWQKIVQVGSGVLAALSGASMIALIANYTEAQAVKWFSALLAFASSILTLVGGAFLDKRDINLMFEGAGKFQALRDRIEVEWNKPNRTSAQAFDTARRFAIEYGTLSHPYERLLPDTWADRDAGVATTLPVAGAMEPLATHSLAIGARGQLGRAAEWVKSDTIGEAMAVKDVAARAASWAKTDGAEGMRRAAAWAKTDGADRARAAAAGVNHASRRAGTWLAALRARKHATQSNHPADGSGDAN